MAQSVAPNDLPGEFPHIFDVTGAIAWTGENSLVIRIGAHPGAVPDWAPPGADCGRVHWAPGIYDRVSLRPSG